MVDVELTAEGEMDDISRECESLKLRELAEFSPRCVTHVDTQAHVTEARLTVVWRGVDRFDSH